MASNKEQYESEKSKVGAVLGAALSGDRDALEHAINDNKSSVLQYCDANSRNALHFAAYAGNTEVCDFILSCLVDDNTRKAGLDMKDVDGNTAFLLAVKAGKIDTAKLLFNHAKQLKAHCIDDEECVHEAAKSGNVDVMKMVLDDFELSKYANSEASIGTPIFWCACDNNVPVARLLVNAGANVNITDSEGVSPLFIAVTSGAEDMIAFLLENGASIYVETSKDGKTTVLHAAAGNGLSGPVKCIMEKADNPMDALNFKSRGMTPAEFAAFSGHNHLVEEFIKFSGGDQKQINDIINEMTEKRLVSEAKFEKEYEDGIESLKKSKEIGNTNFLKGETSEAIQSYSQAIDLARELVYKLESFRNRDSVAESKKIDEIKESYLAALLCNRSACHLKLNNFEDARADAESATMVHHKWPKAFYRLGLALGHLDRHADAAQAFWTGYELAPNATGSKAILDLFKKEVALGKEQAQK